MIREIGEVARGQRVRRCVSGAASDVRQAAVGSARAARLDRRRVGVEADEAGADWHGVIMCDTDAAVRYVTEASDTGAAVRYVTEASDTGAADRYVLKISNIG